MWSQHTPSMLHWAPIVGLLAALGCNKAGQANQPLSPDTVLGDLLVESTVCADGGEVNAGRVVVTLPPGAFDGCTTVSVREASDAPAGRLGTAYEVWADSKLLAPAIVSIRHPSEEVPQPLNYRELKLGVLADGRWTLLPNTEVDVESSKLRGTLLALGTVGVIPHVKVDLLWVTEHSGGMRAADVHFSASLSRTLNRLGGTFPSLSVRVAAVTPGAAASFGQFNSRGVQMDLQETLLQPGPCEGDEECISKLGQGWRCFRPWWGPAYNGATMDTCYRGCEDAQPCCAAGCTPDLCPELYPCGNESCYTYQESGCPFVCGEESVYGPKGVGPTCRQRFSTPECPENIGPVLELTFDDGQLVDQGHSCLLVAPGSDGISPSHVNSGTTNDYGFKAAWRALDPTGPHADQAAGFLREDAFLLIVFLAYDTECSVDDRYCAARWSCDSDDDCDTWSLCREDQAFSEFSGAPSKQCCGMVGEEFTDRCAFMGEYMGAEKMRLAQNKEALECSKNSDCEPMWRCSDSHKCVPILLSSPEAASYQEPTKMPFHSLWPVADVKTSFERLKAVPGTVFVAAIAGDSILGPEDSVSHISPACLEDTMLPACQAYREAKAADGGFCMNSPKELKCAEFNEARLACSYQCWMASKGGLHESDIMDIAPICAGTSIHAESGQRFFQLTRLFGQQGFSANICAPEGTGQIMDDMGVWIRGGLERSLGME